METAMKRASFLDTLMTVLAGFIGVRRKSDHEAARFKPVHIVVLAILLAAVFVLTLVTIVGLVTS